MGAAVCVMAAGLVTGCTGDDGGSSTTTPTSTGSTMTGKVSEGTGTVAGARKELEDFTCSADSKGQWAAKGTVTNTGDSKQRYTVQVLVSKSKTSTVIGSADKSFELAPKKSMDVTLAKVVVSTAKGLVCTPVVTKEPAQ